MNIVETIKGWFNMILKSQIQKEFKIKPIESPQVDLLMSICAKVYQGTPGWIDAEDHVKTINFAGSVCSETARLATLGIGIHIDGSARAKWLQEQVDKMFFHLRDWTEYGAGFGTVIMKPNGETVELYTRGTFEITHQTGGMVDGAVFMDVEGEYVRLEDHRFLEDGTYQVMNKAFRNDRPVSLENSPWSDLDEVVTMTGIDRPLFGVLRMPHANKLDPTSPYALPVFSDALQELEDLDVAYSRNGKEVRDSKRIVLLDSDKLIASGAPVKGIATDFDNRRKELKLPDYVRNVLGNGVETFYQEINPTLQTETRLEGINALLSQIGYKVGFSNGYFVFNEKSGVATATQVESDDRRTIQFIKDVRDKLEDCMDGLIYALDKFADLYDFAPVGAYEVVYDFQDITYNHEEDRIRWWGYVTAGKVPAWMYFVKFEGMTETEAKAMQKEVTPEEPRLFGQEE